MGIIQTIAKSISEAIGRATSGPFASEVDAIRDGREAEQARAARVKAPDIWPVAEDPEVRLARGTCAMIAEQLAVARRHRDAQLGPAGGIPDALNPNLGPAQQLVEEIEAALTKAAAWVAEAERETRSWIFEKRRPGLVAIDAKLLDGVARDHALALERVHYASETTRLAEGRDPDDLGLRFPLASWGPLVEAARTRTSPWSAPDRPVPHGRVRVRVTQPFRASSSGSDLRRTVGEGVDLTPDEADFVIERGWGERVTT